MPIKLLVQGSIFIKSNQFATLDFSMKTLPFLLLLAAFLSLISTAHSSYTVVVSSRTYNDKQWKPVIEVLVEKHGAQVVEYSTSVTESLTSLRKQFPRHTCFVAQPVEVTKKFIAEVHQLTRKLDDDPYTDTFWGVITGYNATNALEIARYKKPLTVKKVASGTEVALECCTEGLWYDELVKNKYVRKKPGGEVEQLKGPDDTTQAFADVLQEYRPDLFVTSGHATERGWQIGYRYKNGYLKSKAGQIFGVDTRRRQIEISSPNPKVYLPIGSCLMGNIDGQDAMALAWMNDAGVKQMLGYTVPTWFGYQGWGVLDYFVEQPGRYTLTEAFFANHHALIQRLSDLSVGPRDKRGLAFDRDVVAFYGDPAWVAKMAPGRLTYGQSLTRKKKTYTFTIEPKLGSKSFETVNSNGAQRGGRPIVQYIGDRVKDVEILEGADLKPVIADDFILVPRPASYDPDRDYRIVFSAKLI